MPALISSTGVVSNKQHQGSLVLKMDIQGKGINQTILVLISTQLVERIIGNVTKNKSSLPLHQLILHSLSSGPYYVDTDPERNHTETEDFIPFEDDSKSTEVSTVNDPEVLKVEEAGAQNFNISDEISCDDSEDEEVVFIGETVRSNSQVPIELDGPAQAAILPPASYNEVSVEYFYCHICHKHLDDAPVSQFQKVYDSYLLLFFKIRLVVFCGPH
jgi:hypothetical protein